MALKMSFQPQNFIRELTGRNAGADAGASAASGHANRGSSVQGRPETERPMGQHPAQTRSSRRRVMQFINKYCAPKPNVSRFIVRNDPVPDHAQDAGNAARNTNEAGPSANTADIQSARTGGRLGAVTPTRAGSESGAAISEHAARHPFGKDAVFMPLVTGQAGMSSKAAGKRRAVSDVDSHAANLSHDGTESALVSDDMPIPPMRPTSVGSIDIPEPVARPMPGIAYANRAETTRTPLEIMSERRPVRLTNDALVMRLESSLKGLDRFADAVEHIKVMLDTLEYSFDYLKALVTGDESLKKNDPLRKMTTALGSLSQLSMPDRVDLTDVELPLENLLFLSKEATKLCNTVIPTDAGATHDQRPLMLVHLGDVRAFEGKSGAPRLPRTLSSDQRRIIKNALDHVLLLRGRLKQELDKLDPKRKAADRQAVNPINQPRIDVEIGGGKSFAEDFLNEVNRLNSSNGVRQTTSNLPPA